MTELEQTLREIELAVLREKLGAGPSWLVRATPGASGLWIDVGAETIPLAASHACLPRVDLVCLRCYVGGGIGIRVFTGQPSGCPAAHPELVGWLSIATVLVPAGACWLQANLIKEIS